MSYVNYRSQVTPGFLRYLLDLVRYRHLCWNLATSDLRTRFRRSRLGILWAILQPLGYALILAFVYGQLFGQKNYWTFATYVYGGMIVWEFFQTSIIVGMDALVGAQGYLKQARIPFLIFQLRVPISSLVIFFAGIFGLYVMMAALGSIPAPGNHLLLIPAYVLVLLVFTTPLTILFSVIGAQFRDVRYLMTIALQLMFFVSPVMLYREFLDSDHLILLKYLNPLVPLLDMFRGPVNAGTMWDNTSMIVLGVWTGILWLLAIVASNVVGRRIIYAL